MVDWQAAAVFMAAVTWLVSPLFGQPLLWLKNQISWILLKRSTRCEKLCWGNLPPKIASNGISRTNSTAWNNINTEGEQTAERILATRTFLGVIEAMFKVRPTRTERPRYLEQNKNYIRTDRNTLLAFLLSSSAPKSGGGSDGLHSILTFSAGTVFFGRFHRYHTSEEMYIVGRMLSETPVSRWEINRAVEGLPKEVLHRIANGDPPFYRDFITTHSGSRFAHRIKDVRGRCRAGWIITVGFSVHVPVTSYNGRYMNSYREACGRVLKTLETAIWPCFAASTENFKHCELAVECIRRMNSNESGSGLPSFTSGTIFCNTHHDDPKSDPLNTEQCLLAIRIFDENREQPLDGDDKSEMEGILVPVLCAAINGIYKWWQYRNNEGSELPKWLVDDEVRHTPIWIEM